MISLWRRALRIPQVRIGGGLLLLIAGAVLAAPLLAPFGPDEVNPAGRLMAPLSEAIPTAPASAAAAAPVASLRAPHRHLLGTDSVGRDILSRLLFGGRLSLGVGLSAVVLGSLCGGLLGLVSGYFGGWVDACTLWLIDLQLSFPFLLLSIFLLGALGGGILAVVLILALSTWVNYARVVRAQVLSLRTLGYVEAARVTGASHPRILGVHLLPNTLSPLCIIASFSMTQAILTEAGLSFLGVGLDPATPSWGTMLNDGRDYLLDAWWIAVMPGLAISLTVIAITLLGEGLRRLLDGRDPG